MPLTSSLVQEWFVPWSVTVEAHVLDTSVCGGLWCTDSSSSPIIVNLPQSIELDSFLTHFFPSIQLPIIVLGYSTQWAACFISNDLLCPTLLVGWVLVSRINLLDNCQVCSLLLTLHPLQNKENNRVMLQKCRVMTVYQRNREAPSPEEVRTHWDTDVVSVSLQPALPNNQQKKVTWGDGNYVRENIGFVLRQCFLSPTQRVAHVGSVQYCQVHYLFL